MGMRLIFRAILIYFLFFIYLAALGFTCGMRGLRSCTSFSLAMASRGYSLVAVSACVAMASLVADHKLQGTQASAAAALGLISCGSRAREHRHVGSS